MDRRDFRSWHRALVSCSGEYQYSFIFEWERNVYFARLEPVPNNVLLQYFPHALYFSKRRANKQACTIDYTPAKQSHGFLGKIPTFRYPRSICAEIVFSRPREQHLHQNLAFSGILSTGSEELSPYHESTNMSVAAIVLVILVIIGIVAFGFWILSYFYFRGRVAELITATLARRATPESTAGSTTTASGA